MQDYSLRQERAHLLQEHVDLRPDDPGVVDALHPVFGVFREAGHDRENELHRFCKVALILGSQIFPALLRRELLGCVAGENVETDLEVLEFLRTFEFL